MATAVVARTRFGSLKASAQMNLAYSPERPIGRLQRLRPEKTDPTMHRATKDRAPRECG
jgi:hypothetical protein